MSDSGPPVTHLLFVWVGVQDGPRILRGQVERDGHCDDDGVSVVRQETRNGGPGGGYRDEREKTEIVNDGPGGDERRARKRLTHGPAGSAVACTTEGRRPPAAVYKL